MDPATNKREQRGPWGPLDRPVYHYPFGDYLYRSVSGYGAEDQAGWSGTTVLLALVTGFVVGQLAGQQFERGRK